MTVDFPGLGKASAKPGVKRGRPSNAAKAAAAAAEAAARASAEAEMAAAAQSDNDQMGSPNGGYQGNSRGVHYDDARGVTQEEWGCRDQQQAEACCGPLDLLGLVVLSNQLHPASVDTINNLQDRCCPLLLMCT